MGIAKSNGLKLKLHSEIVSKTSELIFSKTAKNTQIYERFVDTIKISSLLHDIGKLTVNFQRFLKGEIKSPGLKFRHNEIGWAFLSKYLSLDYKNRDIILNTVYWHHGISNKLCGNTDSEIINSLDDKSIDNMLSYLIECVGEDNLHDDIYSDSVVSPYFYPKNTVQLPQLMLCRSTVITADRISSEFNDIDLINDTLINNYFNISSPYSIENSTLNGDKRFEDQKEIIYKTTQTTMINASAGFGKTMLGLINPTLKGVNWIDKNNKKTIWVTPRNIIGESLYYSILQDCELLNITPSVQLIIGGKIIKSTNILLKEFEADIIITNIDNFLAPTFKNDIMDSSSLIFGCNVVFDEPHELVTSAPLMAMFINIMRVRHRFTSSNTLLLSATHFDMEFLWDDLKHKTTVLPEKNKHYPAQHNKKYYINVVKENPNIIPNTNTLVIKNTIKSSQKEMKNGDYGLLLHGDFTDEKRANDFKYLIDNYNKTSKISQTKDNIVGTHLIQASLDVSFNNLVEDVLSPQFSMQRGGRCGRWGEFELCNITIVKQSPNGENEGYLKSEAKIKDILYSRNLSDAWYDELTKYDKCTLDLDQRYQIFNDFNKKNSKAIKIFIQNKFDESNSYLSSIYPIKFNNKGKNSDVQTAGSNKLRSVNNEVFFIVEHENGKEWVGPFTQEILNDFDKVFNEDSNVINNMFSTMKLIRDSNDERFEYNDIIDNKKYITLDSIRRMGKKSNTPYIVYDRYYDEKLGIVEKIKENNRNNRKY